MSALVANIQGEGVVIPSPGADKAVGILGISVNYPCELRENDEDGALIAYIPKGYTSLTSCIDAGLGSDGEGNACFVGIPGGSPEVKAAVVVTITYLLLKKYGKSITGCTYTEVLPPGAPIGTPLQTPFWRAALEDALCGPDCVAESFGSSFGGAYKTPEEAIQTVVFDTSEWYSVHNAGPCSEFPCKDLVPIDPHSDTTPFCYHTWCYDVGPRGKWGFIPILWGITLCWGPDRPDPSSSSSSSSANNECCGDPCVAGGDVGPYDLESDAYFAGVAANPGMSLCSYGLCETEDCLCIVPRFVGEDVKWFYFVCGP